jgi:hypothetical protein
MGRPSPYEGLPKDEWPNKTRELLKLHPLGEEALKAGLLRLLAKGFPELGDLEFALDHGMRSKNLPHRYKGLEKGFYPFLARSIALELAKPSPDAWRIEETEWGTLLRCLADSLYSLKILVGGGSEGFPILPSWSGESRPSGYVLAIRAEVPSFFAYWGWLDRDDWCEIGKTLSVGAATVEKKSIKLDISGG